MPFTVILAFLHNKVIISTQCGSILSNVLRRSPVLNGDFTMFSVLASLFRPRSDPAACDAATANGKFSCSSSWDSTRLLLMGVSRQGVVGVAGAARSCFPRR